MLGGQNKHLWGKQIGWRVKLICLRGQINLFWCQQIGVGGKKRKMCMSKKNENNEEEDEDGREESP